MALIMAYKIDLKIRNMTNDNQGHIWWIKGSVDQKDKAILSSCTSKTEPQNNLNKN